LHLWNDQGLLSGSAGDDVIYAGDVGDEALTQGPSELGAWAHGGNKKFPRKTL